VLVVKIVDGIKGEEMERELSVAERVMWMSHQVGCANCLFTAHVSGKLDENVLRTALDLLARRHPLLGSRIEVRGIRPFFVSDSVSQIPLRVRTRHGDDDWHDEAETELNDPIRMSAGPLLRAVLIKSDTTAEVLLTCHHIITDAKSGINLISELLELAGQIMEGNLSPKVTELAAHPPVEEILPREARGVGGFLKAGAFIVRQLLNALIQRPSKLPKDSDAPPQDCRARLLQRRLSAEETEALLIRCREEHTTIQGAVCAAVLEAVAGQIHNNQAEAKPITLTCASAVDLRPVLSRPIKDEVGNFASIVVTTHRVGPEIHFWKLAQIVKTDLRRAIGRSEPSVSLSLLNKFLPRKIKPTDLIKTIAKFNSPLMVSNVGVIRIPEKYGPIILRGVHPALSMTAFPENVEATVSTYSNQLGVNLSYSEPTMSRKRMTRLMEDTMDILQSAARLPMTIPSVAAEMRTPPKCFPAETTVKG